jgi:hypothetical protein
MHNTVMIFNRIISEYNTGYAVHLRWTQLDIWTLGYITTALTFSPFDITKSSLYFYKLLLYMILSMTTIVKPYGIP